MSPLKHLWSLFLLCFIMFSKSLYTAASNPDSTITIPLLSLKKPDHDDDDDQYSSSDEDPWKRGKFLSLASTSLARAHGFVSVIKRCPFCHPRISFRKKPRKELGVLPCPKRDSCDGPLNIIPSDYQPSYHSDLFYSTRGSHFVSLDFGTPPETIPFVVDTGSSVVKIPCNSRYICRKCSFPTSTSNPTSFSTAGKLMLETASDYSDNAVQPVLVRCSGFSAHQQPAIVSGFGPGPESFPSQMGLNKFSYCLPTHGDSHSNSLNSGVSKYNPKGLISYTPLYVKPSLSMDSYFYYVNLQEIVVGGKRIKVPNETFLVPGSNGTGGTIVDMGTPFTFMESSIYRAVEEEFEKQMVNYTRLEGLGNLGPCFNISNEKTGSYPELTFKFEGGAEMDLQWTNLMVFDRNLGIECLAIVTDDRDEFTGGPAIILGNHQQKNFYVEFDLEKQRIGFESHGC